MDKEALENTKKQLIAAEKVGYENIDSSLCKKRLAWLGEHIDDVNEKTIVKKAYTLLLIKKMGLSPKEVPITFESNKKIVYRSYNWCPVLEVCKELGLDTRKVCKLGYENSVTKFLQKIDPHLRFSRNYELLRPYGDYCEETIELIE